MHTLLYLLVFLPHVFAQSPTFTYCGDTCTIIFNTGQLEVADYPIYTTVTDMAQLSQVQADLISFYTTDVSFIIDSPQTMAPKEPLTLSLADGSTTIPCCGNYSAFTYGLQFGDESCQPSKTYTYPFGSETKLASLFITAVPISESLNIDNVIGPNSCVTKEIAFEPPPRDVEPATKIFKLFLEDPVDAEAGMRGSIAAPTEPPAVNTPAEQTQETKQPPDTKSEPNNEGSPSEGSSEATSSNEQGGNNVDSAPEQSSGGNPPSGEASAPEGSNNGATSNAPDSSSGGSTSSGGSSGGTLSGGPSSGSSSGGDTSSGSNSQQPPAPVDFASGQSKTVVWDLMFLLTFVAVMLQ